MRSLGAFIDWLLRNFLRILLIGAIIFGALTLGIQACENRLDAPPDISKARYAVTTPSRAYFTSSITSRSESGAVTVITGPYVLQPTSKNVMVLKEYWTKENDKWVYKRGTLELSDAYGKREVMSRSVK